MEGGGDFWENIRFFELIFRWLSSAQDAFEKAQADLKKLPEEPDNETKLKIYALFKQVSELQHF